MILQLQEKKRKNKSVRNTRKKKILFLNVRLRFDAQCWSKILYLSSTSLLANLPSLYISRNSGPKGEVYGRKELVLVPYHPHYRHFGELSSRRPLWPTELPLVVGRHYLCMFWFSLISNKSGLGAPRLLPNVKPITVSTCFSGAHFLWTKTLS